MADAVLFDSLKWPIIRKNVTKNHLSRERSPPLPVESLSESLSESMVTFSSSLHSVSMSVSESSRSVAIKL